MTFQPDIVYPSSDGKPMAENTLQYRWIVTVKGGVDALFRHDPNVFVAGDLLWYPVEGEPRVNQAPDVLVAFGRPRGDRKSYKQWEEGDVAPQVVFKVLSGSSDTFDWMDQLDFYDTHRVEEYYIYDPHRIRLAGYLRKGTVLRRIPQMIAWVSPRLGVRFEIGQELEIYTPDGHRFRSYEELVEEWDRERQRADRAEAELERLRALIREKGLHLNGPQP